MKTKARDTLWDFLVFKTRPFPYVVVLIFCLIYGFFATAESSVLSTAINGQVSFAYLGTAMAFQSFRGWGAAIISPIVFGAVPDKTNPVAVVKAAGFTPVWGPAFACLEWVRCQVSYLWLFLVKSAYLAVEPERAYWFKGTLYRQKYCLPKKGRQYFLGLPL